nr:MAG TPA: hypothetical protein [Caudoviricetes sp.]
MQLVLTISKYCDTIIMCSNDNMNQQRTGA